MSLKFVSSLQHFNYINFMMHFLHFASRVIALDKSLFLSDQTG